MWAPVAALSDADRVMVGVWVVLVIIAVVLVMLAIFGVYNGALPSCPLGGAACH